MKSYMVRATVCPADKVNFFHRMQLTVYADGRIGKATCETSTFGYNADDLVGRTLESLVETWPSGIEGLALLEELLSRGKADHDQCAFRVGVRASTGMVVPGVLAVVGSEGSTTFSINLHRAELLEGTLDIDTQGKRECLPAAYRL